METSDSHSESSSTICPSKLTREAEQEDAGSVEMEIKK